MALNQTNIRAAYYESLGRLPTTEELMRWDKPGAASDYNDLVKNLTQTPEATQFKSTGVPSTRTVQKGETVQLGTTGTPSTGSFSSSTSSSTPSFSTSGGSVQSSSYAPTYAPNPSFSGGQSFSSGYTPTVDQYGNVAPFVPQGANYSPGQFSSYTPSTTAPATQGGLTQAFAPSGTVSGVNVPAQASQGAYAGIPLNNSGLGSMTIGGGTGEGGVKFPTFTFNFAQEQADAYSRLKPFYEKLLSFAGGRLDLAQRILDYTYQQGMRESRQEYDQSRREQELTFPQEQESMKTTQNQRGITTSGFGNTERTRLQESQGLRREAIERALENRESRLTSEKGFGSEEKMRGFEEEKFGQERERRQESSDLAEKKFSIKQAEYQSEMDKALRSEQKAIRESDRAFQIKMAKGEF